MHTHCCCAGKYEGTLVAVKLLMMDDEITMDRIMKEVSDAVPAACESTLLQHQIAASYQRCQDMRR